MNKLKWEKIRSKGHVNFTLKYGFFVGLVGCFLGLTLRYAYHSFIQGQLIDYADFLSKDWLWIPFLMAWGTLLTYFSWFELQKKYENNH